LDSLKKEGKTILLTSHQQSFLEKLCDTMYCIDEKQICLFNEELRQKYFEI
jgi:ABC-2 type transport system ATP-binding protein